MDLRFKSVTLSAKFDSKEIRGTPWGAWAEIAVPQGKNKVNFVVDVLTEKGKIPLVFHNGRTEEITGTVITSVSVEWHKEFINKQPIMVPRTRNQQYDNKNIILLGTEGDFLHYQVGVVTREGKFFLTIQQIYEGVIANDGSGTVVKPTQAIHAYPGCSFQNICKGMWPDDIMETLLRIAREKKVICRSAGDVSFSKWIPPRISVHEKEWKYGVVLFFNFVTGTGKIRGEDKQTYFVHFRAIPGRGMRILKPMSPILFQSEQSDELMEKAIRVRNASFK